MLIEFDLRYLVPYYLEIILKFYLKCKIQGKTYLSMIKSVDTIKEFKN